VNFLKFCSLIDLIASFAIKINFSKLMSFDHYRYVKEFMVMQNAA